ncbi:MAG TPA: type II secretion system protein GspM [Spirochaetota bacterium]|nr:type II secretion system protein GspM [Spirochaetota bacterium]
MITLNEREKLLLRILAVIAGITAAYYLVVSPLLSYRASSQDESKSSKEKIDKLASIYEDYRETKNKKTQYEKMLRQSKGVTTLIEEYAKKTGILENKVYTRDTPGTRQDQYKKVSTDVKFEGVSIVPMLEFIYDMENSGLLIKISSLRITQAFKGRDTYDVTIKFDSVTKE